VADHREDLTERNDSPAVKFAYGVIDPNPSGRVTSELACAAFQAQAPFIRVGRWSWDLRQ
jgi:hypothetical protein